jgi:hypothetical protein
MEELAPSPEDRHADSCCVFILEDGRSRRICGEVRRRGSSYCPQHHTLCHVGCGTTAEAQRLREVEALARAVGGRSAPSGVGPSRQFINRLEQAVRTLP